MWRVSLLMLLSTASVAQQLSDPTAPPRYSAEMAVSSVTNLQLQSIQWFGDSKMAQISGQRVREGDNLNQYQVLEIELHQVRLMNREEQQEVTLSLFSPIKSDVNAQSGQQSGELIIQ
ncbi:hypothetical protein CWE22_06695 [Pseudidiomarina aestuarii]|uniref:Type II secretory pathway component n=1 Tax=Pseudidiomarina aestuarii TaxID=624146 RepID=A0A7Z6ZV76_9GAMM|nr:hypothetical protein [Pseudidiomarina aestuarii]RUO41836.1 hypothetical protein CWE22_06695 [Pseudidiomarina aestuarii]